MPKAEGIHEKFSQTEPAFDPLPETLTCFFSGKWFLSMGPYNYTKIHFILFSLTENYSWTYNIENFLHKEFYS
jgi:hypothetical protein